jgi:hypothetical protein
MNRRINWRKIWKEKFQYQGGFKAKTPAKQGFSKSTKTK